MAAAVQVSCPLCAKDWDYISSLMKVTLPLLLACCGPGREAMGRRPEAEADSCHGFDSASKTLHMILAKGAVCQTHTL